MIYFHEINHGPAVHTVALQEQMEKLVFQR